MTMGREGGRRGSIIGWHIFSSNPLGGGGGKGVGIWSKNGMEGRKGRVPVLLSVAE